MKTPLIFTWICVLFPSCLGWWECTYENGLGFQTTQTCSSGCCEHDCCPFDAKLFGGIFAGVLFFTILSACCGVYIRRRRRQAMGNVIVMGGPTQTTAHTAIPIGAPVPEHYGYDQSNYQPSKMTSPPPYMATQP